VLGRIGVREIRDRIIRIRAVNRDRINDGHRQDINTAGRKRYINNPRMDCFADYSTCRC
jgi:hypothetical protein